VEGQACESLENMNVRTVNGRRRQKSRRVCSSHGLHSSSACYRSAVVPVEPLNAAEPEAILTEALVDKPPSYFVELMAESIKDFEPVEHVPATGEVVPENATVVFPEPNLGQRMEPEAHLHYDAVPVASTERDTQQIIEPMMAMPIPVPVSVPNYDMPSYPHEHGFGSLGWRSIIISTCRHSKF
jgi:hypothetical protein